MTKQDLIKKKKVQTAFNALSIEGGLLPPEWLAKVAHLQSENQKESDYKIPKGLNLRDEIGRYYRIAQGLWDDCKSNHDTTKFSLEFLKECLGFDDIVPSEAIILKDRIYPITHSASLGKVPIIITTQEEGLDNLSTRFGDGVRKRTAFGLCQEYLNSSEEVLWGIICSGEHLRIIRDNSSLTKPAWIEVDLKRIFDEEQFSDFAAFWLMCHRSRFGAPNQLPHECTLEKWREASRTEGIRANDLLRVGVQAAIEIFGQGFLSSSCNKELRESLQNGTLTVQSYFKELLRLVYRLIFLLTIEERDLLHPKTTSEYIKSLYKDGYGISKLRDRSIKRHAYDRFEDLWQGIKIVFIAANKGEVRLGIPALGGLFDETQTPHLDRCVLENRTLLAAIYRLSWLKEETGIVRINWRDMGPEELGSVYEGLLALVPQIIEEGRRFTFASEMGENQGNARKLTGSYYTPDSLVQSLLDTALEPVIAATICANKERPVEALLKLTVVDPACGSGHFLLGAARRLASHVARLEVHGTPTADDYRKALRQVISHCIYGVDLNPMAVELCKVGLWLEAIEPSKPLSFLDHHVRVGNSLIGTTSQLIALGLPDDAYIAVEGDDKKVCATLKKRNKLERAGWGPLFFQQDVEKQMHLQKAAITLRELPDNSLEDIQFKEQIFRNQEATNIFIQQKQLADTWCAAFVIRKYTVGQGWESREFGITQKDLNTLVSGEALSEELSLEIESLASHYQFLHWHLVFPEVFANGGFDCVIGNPPWEMLKAGEGETSSEEFQRQQLFFKSNQYKTLKGRRDLYKLFLIKSSRLTKSTGRLGFLIPLGVFIEDEASEWRREFFDFGCVHQLRHFQNHKKCFVITKT